MAGKVYRMKIGQKIRVNMTRRAWAKGDAKRDAQNTEPDNLRKFKDIKYGPHGKDNLLDVYLPMEEKTYPVIVNIHGGGYFYGDKELYRFYSMEMALKGFAVVCFNYRLAPENTFPAPLEDIHEVLNWVYIHASEYSLDTNNVFLIGDSAGAQLASQYAAIYSNDSYRSLFGFERDKVSVNAISCACGMYDAKRHFQGMESKRNALMKDYLGKLFGTDDPRFDVLKNINDNYPPTYVFSGKDDFLRAECEPMNRMLQEKGLVSECKIYGLEADYYVGHVFHVDMKHKLQTEANDRQASFFRTYIK